MSTDARIACLRLKTAPGARQGQASARLLIEDALRTEASAAGPGATRGLLVLRGLHAGRVVAKSERSAVQRRVGDTLAEASHRAVAPLDPGAVSADAVLFRDPLEPYTLFADALFQRSRLADAWFFRAIFGRRRGETRAETALSLLRRAAVEPFAPLAIAGVIDRAGSEAPALLSSLSDAEASSLLIALQTPNRSRAWPSASMDPGTRGVEAGADQAKAVAADGIWILPAAVRDSLRRRVRDIRRHLTGDDPRLPLLAAAILIQATGRPAHQAHIEVALSMIMESDARFDPHRAVIEPPPITASDQPGSTRDRTPATPASVHAIREQPDCGFGDLASNRREGGHETSGKIHEKKNDRVLADPAVDRSEDRAPVHDRESGPIAADDAPRLDVPPDGSPASVTQSDSGHPKGPSLQDTVPKPASECPFGEPTAWAGAALMVTAVDRFLRPLLCTSGAMESELGRQLLERMLLRAGCAEGDPARRAFALLSGPAPAWRPGWFCLPMAFDIAGARRPRLHAIDGHPGWRALTCRGGRIVLAMWSGRATDEIRSWLKERGIERGRPLPGDLGSMILRSAELATNAFIRELTGCHPREILARSGWIRSTRAHLDVTFDAALVDLTIRRAGLDIDPGWCSWLFRVVSIHYDYGLSDG